MAALTVTAVEVPTQAASVETVAAQAPSMADDLLLSATPVSVSRGRHWVVGRAEALGASAEVVDVVELLTTELLTNAVVHGGEGGILLVQVRQEGAEMVVAVNDASCELPRIRTADEDETSGRGLLLVESLAASWGAEPLRSGKVVWFRLAL